MKKITSFFVALTLLAIFILPTSSFAAQQDKKTSSDLALDYSSMLGHEDRSYDDLVNGLLENGLTQDEADYYAKMDILTNQIEQQEIDIQAELETVDKIPAEYARINPEEVKNRALNMDLSALKTILEQNDALFYGMQDSKDAIESLDSNSGDYSITIEYPDGSTFSASADVSKEEPELSNLETNTVQPGPWTTSSTFSFIGTCMSETSNYNCNSYWTLTSGSSYARVTDYYRWYFNYPGQYVSYNSDTGSSYNVGVVQMDYEVLSNHAIEYSDSSVIQGYTDVRFEVSSNFSASFAGIGVDVTAGGGWHSYCVTEVFHNGMITCWAASS